jgi:hypothetical protein
VGSTFIAAGAAPAGPVAIHWNGSAWSTAPTPAPSSTERFRGLLAVSASAATDARAMIDLVDRREVPFRLPLGPGT